MARVGRIEWDEAGWDQMLTGIVESWARPLADDIADKANEHVRRAAEADLAQQDSAPKGNTPADVKHAELLSKRRRMNRRIAHTEPPEGKRDYMVSTEGSNPLSLKDYRATVITVTDRAKIDNARNNTLVRYLNGGGA